MVRGSPSPRTPLAIPQALQIPFRIDGALPVFVVDNRAIIRSSTSNSSVGPPAILPPSITCSQDCGDALLLVGGRLLVAGFRHGSALSFT